MKPGGRLQAAIEVLSDIEQHHRPAIQALSDWGRTHRFAGSGDRAVIGTLVFDALRQRSSIAWRMGEDSPRALALGAAVFVWGESPETIAAWCDGDRHAPLPLSEAERERLRRPPADDAPDWVRGDYPDWLHASFVRAFADRAAEEGAALATRAPIDLRVNTLKAEREKVLKALARFRPAPTPLSPVGVRIAAARGAARNPHIEADPAHGKGWFEVQDEGSQVAALLTAAGPRQQVADICAGSGGKTLALAACMRNTGQIYAYDGDPLRLRPIFERLKRAGVRNVQVLPAGDAAALDALAAKLDIVMVDAPCTGTGAWRRRPDAKWRLQPHNLAARRAEQSVVLDLGAPLVKPGGRLVYITCSVLPEENDDQVAAFLDRHRDFVLRPYGAIWRQTLPGEPASSADGRSDTLLLTPARHGTGGFFIAVLEKRTQ